MSTYAISDLHGYPLEKLKKLLGKIGFGDCDTLYVIGDVVDRNGEGGVELLRWMMAQPNVEFILGNHEDMLLRCAFLFEEVTEEALARLTIEHQTDVERYLRNGGGVTLRTLKRLYYDEPQAFADVMDFLRQAPVIGAATVGERDFIFVHGGFKDFAPDKKLSQYFIHDLLWERPTLETEYFDNIITVFGHTPTLYYGSEYEGKVIKTRTWINIDAGAASGLPPALLRLDDLEVFYADDGLTDGTEA